MRWLIFLHIHQQGITLWGIRNIEKRVLGTLQQNSVFLGFILLKILLNLVEKISNFGYWGRVPKIWSNWYHIYLQVQLKRVVVKRWSDSYILHEDPLPNLLPPYTTRKYSHPFNLSNNGTWDMRPSLGITIILITSQNPKWHCDLSSWIS